MNAKAQTVGSTDFDTSVLQSDKPVLVDFWAAWCGPCRAIAPTVDRLADRFEGKATIAKVDVDQHGALASKYQVHSIPTLILFDQGQPVKRFVGLQSEDALAEAIEDTLSASHN